MKLPVETEIRVELARAKRSQAWLATEAGLPASTLSRKLSGAVEMSIAELAAIASVLGLTASEIIARAEATLENQAAS